MSHLPASRDHSTTLRSAGLRVTQPRLAVLAALEARPHARTDEVIECARATVTVSTQAVYDVLGALTSHGVVRRIQPAGSVARYELRAGDNHHHVVCRSCGRIVDVDCTHGSAPCLEPADLDRHAPGFVLDEAEVTYWGTCSACRERPAPTG